MFTIKKFLEFIKTDCEYVLWLNISKDLFLSDQNILTGCIYIPPEFSKYSSNESFIEIEEELLSLSQNTENIFLIGDFNARTGIQNDFVIDDVKLQDILHIEDDLNDCKSCHIVLSENNIVDRHNQDLGRVNNFGLKLLDFCKRGNIFIVFR